MAMATARSHVLIHLSVPDGDDWPCVVQPCGLYLNEKPPTQNLFAAAAALYALTGSAYYRGDADSLWPSPEDFPELLMYLYNWNNVVPQVRRPDHSRAVMCRTVA